MLADREAEARGVVDADEPDGRPEHDGDEARQDEALARQRRLGGAAVARGRVVVVVVVAAFDGRRVGVGRLEGLRRLGVGGVPGPLEALGQRVRQHDERVVGLVA